MMGKPWRSAWVATAIALAIVAAACTGQQESRATPDGTQAGAGPTAAADGPASPGGRLVYGLDAESDGWDPTSSQWAGAGLQVANAIFDPLMVLDAAGEPAPYLAESVTPNADQSEWTIRLRPGVSFHDGTPLTSEAVVATVDQILSSPLTAKAAEPIESAEASDELTTVIALDGPWPAFPFVLTGQTGMVAAPSQLSATGEARTRRPVGTGPFRFGEWIPDTSLTVTRNETYWRDGLPYLDEVEFRVITDTASRLTALETGDIDAMATDDTLALERLASDGGASQTWRPEGEQDEVVVMFNLDAPAVSDPRIRRALALATDQQALVDVVGPGSASVALGPFAGDSPWYRLDVAPATDLEEARNLLREDGAGELAIRLKIPSTPEALVVAQVLDQQWGAIGVDVEIIAVEQAAMIGQVLFGDYEAVLWRGFGDLDPDANFIVLGGSNYAPVGQLALNFARVQDAELDRALTEGRRSIVVEARQDAYGRMQERLAELVPYVWLTRQQWSVNAGPDVRSVARTTLPNDEEAMPFRGPVHRLTETWLSR